MDRTQAIIAMNELISNSAGLYNTSIEQEDGSFLHYMHDSPYLEDSITIYTQTASGYAWTNNGWNDGAPVWQYGFDQQGNMIMNAISAYRIEADLVVLESGDDAESVITHRLSAGELIIRDTIRNGGHNILKNPRFGGTDA